MTDEMKEKTVIVTGANSGIGFETYVGLAGKGAEIIMMCRNEQKGLEAMGTIKKRSGNENIKLIIVDFSSLESVRTAANEILAKYRELHVLVNNAGGVVGKRTLTKDGFETTFGVNHLAPFLLTNMLLPLLKSSAPSRVVTVSSMAHLSGHINFDDLQSEKRYSMMGAYGMSKLANVLFTSELAKRLQGTQVTSNCLHPGVVATNFGSGGGALISFFYRAFAFAMVSPEKGARTSIYLASSPEVEGVTGKYFVNCKEAKPSKESMNQEIAKRLWDISIQLVKFQ